ncbi:hypothetical protein CALVIDRAFT_539038 [Calocera viscosa TUFC12733]|uniref:DNA replication complex GINS protein PSF1 n=1 Tax=Calocera viscosa (strain TUFC12733) TaxID=1330018 RepID=A0A167KFC5_CALVF|nr:hypothetical protein CALVIDRAFT_539038 [Calocera viscosa TUFC12733]
MSTDPSQALLLECRRSTQTDTLFPYNAAVVTTLVRQIHTIHAHLVQSLRSAAPPSDEVMPTPTPPPAIMFTSTHHHLQIRRLKRVLLVYHAHRLHMLRAMLHRAHLSVTHLLPTIRPLLSPSELTFIRSYAQITMNYRAEFIDVLDIAASVDEPPKGMWVNVRVVKEVGEVITEGGVVDFRKGGRYLVRRGDVEMLLVQGYLEVVD